MPIERWISLCLSGAVGVGISCLLFWGLQPLYMNLAQSPSLRGRQRRGGLGPGDTPAAGDLNPGELRRLERLWKRRVQSFGEHHFQLWALYMLAGFFGTTLGGFALLRSAEGGRAIDVVGTCYASGAIGIGAVGIVRFLAVAWSDRAIAVLVVSMQASVALFVASMCAEGTGAVSGQVIEVLRLVTKNYERTQTIGLFLATEASVVGFVTEVAAILWKWARDTNRAPLTR